MANNKLLLQTGDFLLLTTGDKLLLQTTAETLLADAGSYSVTGASATLNIIRSPSLLEGSYSVAGYPVTLDVSRTLPIFPNLLVILPDESRFI